MELVLSETEAMSKAVIRKVSKSNNDIKYFILIALICLLILAILIIIFIVYFSLKIDEIMELYREIPLLNREITSLKKNISFMYTILSSSVTNQTALELYHKFNDIVKYDKERYSLIFNCLVKDPDKELCIYPYLKPKKVKGKKRIFFGSKKDGGYVLLDDFNGISKAYSFGIDKMVDFDYALSEKNIDVYMYDHTIRSLPSKYANYSKFHWNKIGITEVGYDKNNLKSLKTLIKENGHLKEKNMILKLDVEYSEWKSLLNLPSSVLKQFKYIVLEYHFFHQETELYFKVLKKISQTHQVFYLHCNNCSPNTYLSHYNYICTALEVSYVIKKGNEFEEDDSTYPIKDFDFNNCFKPPNNYNLNILQLF